MKKKFKIIVMIFAFLLILPLGLLAIVPSQTYAASVSESDEKFEAFSAETDEIIKEFSKINNRIAGTTDEIEGRTEKSAAEYIVSKLSTTPLTPKDDAHVIGGVQNFQFLSNFTGVYQNSSNIIYEYKVNDSANKILIGTSYDAYAIKTTQTEIEVVGVEGINGSAGSVALLLYLARHIQELNLGINVEIAFFGAGGCNNAGSKVYVQGLDAEEQKNLLCMINLENIAIGKNMYFYVDEFENSLSKFMANLNTEKATEIKQVGLVHLNKAERSHEESMGLGYTHLAMDSNNFNFMKLGITSVNIFAGDYESGIVMGRAEYSYLDSITYTENDNLAYIEEHYDKGLISKNLYKVYGGLFTTLGSDEFVEILKQSQGQTKVDYTAFANTKLALILTVVGFGVMICVAIVIYFHLTKKSYYSNIEVEFLSTIVKITDQLGEKDSDLGVTKIVSQTIANDIKKNKTIKPKKKKK